MEAVISFLLVLAVEDSTKSYLRRETGNSPFFLIDRKEEIMIMDEWVQNFISDVECLAKPLLDSEGLTLVDIEYQRETKGWTLRLFIDKDGGVTLQDCTYINNQLGDILDAKLDFDVPYHLEVSSPGLDKPLRKPEHFVYFRGRQAVIKTEEPVGGKRYFRGRLGGLSDNVVLLEVEGELLHIPYENIKKACLDG